MWAPVDFEAALAFARAEHRDRSQNWTGYCQKFCRSAYHLPGGFGTAYAQWLGLPDDEKHVGGHLSEVPVGAMIFSKGKNPAGHIFIASRPFGKTGTAAGWSTDLVRLGYVDKIARTAILSSWNHTYVGWGGSLNGYDLRYKGRTGTAPRFASHQARVASLIDTTEGSLEQESDEEGSFLLSREIDRLKAFYDNLKD